MIAAPLHGFVFLAMPKAASTSIERTFTKYGQVVMQGPAAFKHINYLAFNRHVRPILRARGYERDSYEVSCLFREPIDWLASWWRYRSRPRLTERDELAVNYLGDVSFDEFARAYIDRSQPWAMLGRPAKFVRNWKDGIGVDRIYRLEDINEMLQWLRECVGEDVSIPEVNVSPKREVELSEETRRMLEEHFAAEYEVYNEFTVGRRKSARPKISI